MAPAGFICSILANIMSGIVIEYFEARSEMTVPMICVVRALFDIGCCSMVYAQQKFFYLSLTGSVLQILIAKGWTAPAILILKTVVPPEVAPYSIGMFLLVTNITSSTSAQTFAKL